MLRNTKLAVIQLTMPYHPFNISKLLISNIYCRYGFTSMKKPCNSDTIYAVSSGISTAISIIRVCGQQSHRVLQMLAGPNHGNKQHKLSIPPRTALLRNIYTVNKKLIDKCIILHFPEENSFNNQKIYQLHVHGSRAVISLIFEELKAKGLRMAERGEFTKRAVLNGKISLRQAQAIDDLVKSQNQFARQVAITGLLGKGQDFLGNLRASLIKVLVNIQAYIDFQQDEADVKQDLFFKNKAQVEKVIKTLNKVLENSRNLQLFKNGVTITIIGKPNVGKSTLINSLTRREVSIVSEEPGTTRDVIQASIEHNEILMHLIDTAGLRETKNKIQSEGIRRAKQKMQQSHYRLYIIDITQEQIKVDQQQKIAKIYLKETPQITEAILDEKTIVIANKSDLIPSQYAEMKFVVSLQKQQTKIVQRIICADLSDGIDTLLDYLAAKIQKQYPIFTLEEESVFFTRQRYFDKLEKCKGWLISYLQQDRPDIACEYLRNSLNEISQIFGRIDSEDVLDVLFRDFCIGK